MEHSMKWTLWIFFFLAILITSETNASCIDLNGAYKDRMDRVRFGIRQTGCSHFVAYTLSGPIYEKCSEHINFDVIADGKWRLRPKTIDRIYERATVDSSALRFQQYRPDSSELLETIYRHETL